MALVYSHQLAVAIVLALTWTVSILFCRVGYWGACPLRQISSCVEPYRQVRPAGKWPLQSVASGERRPAAVSGERQPAAASDDRRTTCERLHLGIAASGIGQRRVSLAALPW